MLIDMRFCKPFWLLSSISLLALHSEGQGSSSVMRLPFMDEADASVLEKHISIVGSWDCSICAETALLRLESFRATAGDQYVVESMDKYV